MSSNELGVSEKISQPTHRSTRTVNDVSAVGLSDEERIGLPVSRDFFSSPMRLSLQRPQETPPDTLPAQPNAGCVEGNGALAELPEEGAKVVRFNHVHPPF